MKKTVHMVAKPVWGGQGNGRFVKSFSLEGPFVKAPPPSRVGNGVGITFEMDIDDALFKPPTPKVEIHLELDDTKNEVKVTGLRVRSEAAKSIIGKTP